MKTLRGLKPGEALLVGRLRIINLGQRWTYPTLAIGVWCPYCKREHSHGWVADGERFESRAVDHRCAHCDDGSPLRDGYWIGLDPAAKAENRAAFERCRRLVADWIARHPGALAGSGPGHAPPA